MDTKKKVLAIIWWIYIVLLLVVVVIKFNGSFGELRDRVNSYSMEGSINYNLIPFRSLGAQVSHISQGWALKNLLGNLVSFMPFGFLLPIAYGKINTYIKVFIVGCLSIISMELLQLITKLGSFDVDDIILNMVGVSIGYLAVCFMKRSLNKR